VTFVNTEMQSKNLKNKHSTVITTNLDTATPEQKEKFMKVLVEAHRILYRSVVERRAKLLVECGV